jgi:type III secretory pathway component EscT
VTPSFAQIIAELAGLSAGELIGLLRWWARVAPAVLLVPAFGLRAVPVPMRVALGLALAVAAGPSAETSAHQGLLAVQLAIEMLRGLPVAVTAATALWIATMAGGLVDNLRGAQEGVGLPNVEAGSTPVGALLSMLVALAFLQGGGPARVMAALSEPSAMDRALAAQVATTLAGGVELAVAVAAPLLAVSVVVEVASALFARAAAPAFVQPLLAPLRSFVVLAVLAVLLERIAEILVLGVAVFT